MVELKITRQLYEKIRRDLLREHSFALERVGFVSTRIGSLEGENKLVIASSYRPISDDLYIDDPAVGARINAQAIRDTMQNIMDSGEGALHVHMHEHRGKPWFSRVDRVELIKIIKSFQVVGPHAAHGALLLSNDSAAALIWLPDDQEPNITTKITIVGYPMTFLR